MPRTARATKPTRKKAKSKKRPPRPKRPTCHTCGRKIHVPEGWSVGAASRRHYWARHRDVMRPTRTS